MSFKLTQKQILHKFKKIPWRTSSVGALEDALLQFFFKNMGLNLEFQIVPG